MDTSTQHDTSFLTPAWSTDTTSMSQLENPSWDAQPWGFDDVDMDSFFCLPPSIDDSSDTVASPINTSPTAQNLADFYWSLAAAGQSTIAPSKLAYGDLNGAKPIPNTWQTYCAPLSPPEHDQFFSTESEQGTPSPNSERSPLSPASSSDISSPTSTKAPGRVPISANKKMLRTSIRKSSAKDTIKQEPEASPKDTKTLRARSCHNLVEKKYRNRLNNHFELLLTTVTETRKRAASSSSQVAVGGFGRDAEIDMDSGDDNESWKGGDVDKDQKDRSMSKSDVLRLARETVLGLERKNRLLVQEVKRLRGLREAAVPGGMLMRV